MLKKWVIRPLWKFHLVAKIALFGIFDTKFFDYVYSHALKILSQICTKMANFIKQSEFPKRSVNLLLFWLFFSKSIDAHSLMDLAHSLDLAAYWDQKTYSFFPNTFNHLLTTGYFSTPSARMTADGEVGFGVSYVPPYLNWNGRIQPYSHLEVSVNYRIFCGYKDPNLSPYGFGDYADRGANFKLALFTPEQSLYRYPGIAFGIEDFLGSKKFTTYYLVATYVSCRLGIEWSLGWGAGRYAKGPTNGFFSGLNWFPFFNTNHSWSRSFCLTAECDPINYATDPYPKRINSLIPLNFGAKYKFRNLLEFSGCYLRGNCFALSSSIHYNWGKTEGFLPKVKDYPPYTAPIDREPLGCFKPKETMIQSLNYSFEKQGLQLTKAWLEVKDENNFRLILKLMNFRYRQEHLLRFRLQQLLAYLTPSNVSEVVIVLESYGLPCQKYVYRTELLQLFADRTISAYEFDILSPRLDVTALSCSSEMIFQRRSDLWRYRFSPLFETFLSSAHGKFKYDAGIRLLVDGFLPTNWLYEIQASFITLSSINKLPDSDFFCPSQIPNVATDYIRYRQEGAFKWDMLYLQKSWNCKKGFFARISGGYFQVNYAGLAAETLWYPARSLIALGLEGAIVKKRSYSGLGFQSKLRHFERKKPVYFPYTTLQQYFLNFYLDIPSLCTFTKIAVGQFLAGDKGVKFELTRYFDNGLRLTGWITVTDAHDMIHCQTYFDKGVAIELPLDFFYKRSSRRVWNYATAAWLRDAGYATTTGRPLFEMINRERRF